MRTTPFRLAALTLALPVLLAGCSANFNGTLSGALPAAGPTLRGVVMGGRQPITGSHLYLYRAPSGGADSYGTAATSVLVAGGTSVSTPVSTGTAPGNTVVDGNGSYYVVTGTPDGSFNITNDYSCAPSDQMFLVSQGGNPGLGNPNGNNTAAVLMAALGSCASLNASTNIVMNELTTIAAVYALQQFMTDATHVAAPSANQQGLQNAFITADSLVNFQNGTPNTSTSTVSFPSDKIYTLGDVMAACVNTAGYTQGDHGACDSFFAASVMNGGTSFASEPSDTVAAMLSVAQHPGATAAGIFAIIPTFKTYGSTLTAANDLSLPLAYTSGLVQPTSVAVDANGNAYVANCRLTCDVVLPSTSTDDIVRISPNGTITALGNGTIHNAQGIAVDTSNSIWVTDMSPSVLIYNQGGALQRNITNPANPPNFAQPEGIALDPNNLAYVANAAGSNVQTVDSGGNFGSTLTIAGGGPGTSLIAPVGVAIDPNANIVVTDAGSPASSIDGGIAVFTPAAGGTFTSTITKASGFHPGAVALDNSHNIWTVDSTVLTASAPKLFQYDFTGTTRNVAAVITGAGTVQGLAIDGSGNVLVPSCNSSQCSFSGSDALFVLDNTGTPTLADGVGTAPGGAAYYGLRDASLSQPVGVAIDGSGNAWVTNANSGAVTVFVGLASPVVTPLSIAVQNSKVGVKP